MTGLEYAVALGGIHNGRLLAAWMDPDDPKAGRRLLQCGWARVLPHVFHWASRGRHDYGDGERGVAEVVVGCECECPVRRVWGNGRG